MSAAEVALAEPTIVRRARMTVAYDGTEFHGFAEADGVRTVMGDLRSAVETVVRRPVDPVGAGRTDAGRIMESSDHLANVLDRVPAIVIPCQLGRLRPDQSNQEISGYFGSVIPAVWNFMLAARSRGLGTAWTTLHLKYELEVADILGIPHSVTQVALTPLAYYTGDDFKVASRLPVEKVTYLNEWKHGLDGQPN